MEENKKTRDYRKCFKSKTGLWDPANKEKVRKGNIKGGKIGGKGNVEEKRGFLDPANKERCREGHIKGGKIGGKIVGKKLFEEKKGIFDLVNKEKVKEGRKIGGVMSGKKRRDEKEGSLLQNTANKVYTRNRG